jgi:hypothetical protein
MRLPQTIGVFVQLLECAALRTNESLTKDIFAIAADAHNLVIDYLDSKATRGLTERARPEHRACGRHGIILP